MSNFFNGIMDFGSMIGDFGSMVGNGIRNFIDFIIALPTLIYSILNLIPDPLRMIINVLIGFLIFVLLIKVVRLIVG